MTEPGHGTVTLDIEADTTRFREAIHRVIQALNTHAAAITRIARHMRRPIAIVSHGPRNVAGDATWQTDLCAAWIHGSCPSPRDCDCTCHGGPVR